jgi:hypothetical protein
MSKDSKNIDLDSIVSGGSNAFTKTVARDYSFYLSGEILEPSEYIEWFDTIRSAGPNDSVTIHIN